MGVANRQVSLPYEDRDSATVTRAPNQALWGIEVAGIVIPGKDMLFGIPQGHVLTRSIPSALEGIEVAGTVIPGKDMLFGIPQGYVLTRSIHPLRNTYCNVDSEHRHLPRLLALSPNVSPVAFVPGRDISIPGVDMGAGAMDLCRRKALWPYIQPIRDMIRVSFHGIMDISVGRVDHPEDTEYEKLWFEIYIESEPDRIIKDQHIFYDAFFTNIPAEKRDFFLFSYKVLQT